MALVGPTLLTADPDTANVASYATPSVSPTAGAGLLVFVWNTDGTNAIQPTISAGFAITGSWTTEATLQATAATRRVTLFSGYASGSPGSGTVTADFAGDAQTGCTVIVVEYTGQDGTDFVLQPATNQTGAGATSLAVTLAGALGDAANQICAAIGHNTQEDQTAGGGGTELASSDVGYATPASEFGVYSEVNDNSVSASWATSSAALAIACEVKAAAGGTTTVVAPAGILNLTATAPVVAEALAAPAGILVLGATAPVVADAMPATAGVLTLGATAPSLGLASVINATPGILTLGAAAPVLVGSSSQGHHVVYNPLPVLMYLLDRRPRV